MKLYKVKLGTVDGRRAWFERVEAFNERNVVDAVYARYGLAVCVLAVS